MVGTWYSLPGPRFDPWLGSKLPQATECSQKKKKKKTLEKQIAILLCFKSNDRKIMGYY